MTGVDDWFLGMDEIHRKKTLRHTDDIMKSYMITVAKCGKEKGSAICQHLNDVIEEHGDEYDFCEECVREEVAEL